MAKSRYEVEWCSEIPIDECGDADHDSAVYKQKYFDNFEDAIAFAKTLIDGIDYYGSPRVEYQELTIDTDILEHEGWAKKRWYGLRYLHVDEKEYNYTEKDFEYMY